MVAALPLLLLEWRGQCERETREREKEAFKFKLGIDEEVGRKWLVEGEQEKEKETVIGKREWGPWQRFWN